MPRPASNAGTTSSASTAAAIPALDALGVRQVQGDLADRDAVRRTPRRAVERVFHNAAKAGAWGSYDDYHRANVVGTDNVIAACRAHGIGSLVYTSTPSVTHRATHPVEGGTADTVPYGAGLQGARTRPPRRSPSRQCSPPTTRRSRPSRCARA